MKAKKGISLIVLVITIIVIIILAAAVLLTLNNNNPINNSKQATFDSDVAEVKSAINMYISNFMAKNPNHDGPFDPTTEQDWVTIGTANTEAAYAELTKIENVGGVDTKVENPNPTTTYGDGVTWEDLNVGKPASIRFMLFNCETGAIIAVPTQTDVTYIHGGTEYKNDIADIATLKNKAGIQKMYGEE